MSRLRRRRHDDRGVSLVLVAGTMMIIFSFLTTLLAVTMKGQVTARGEQDAKIAQAGAQAGLDEYLSRLTSNPSYWSLGDSDSTNPAFAASGQTIQGTSGKGSTYRYHVLSSTLDVERTGTLQVQVTGTSSAGPNQPAVSRSLIANLRVNGFLSYLYLSDKEVADPAIDGSQASCANYYYATPTTPARPAGKCNEIQWVTGDALRGPLHSNDALDITGAVDFTAKTESSWPALQGSTSAKTWWGTKAPPLPDQSPVYAPAVPLPVANTDLLKDVEPNITGSGPAGPGCYYQGATEIVFQHNSMKIRSPMTTRNDTPQRCLNVGQRTKWQTISPIPPLIYVDSASTTGCTTGNTSAFSYPQSGESYTIGGANDVTWGESINYTCTRGSAYVQGVTDSAVTVAADDDVVVTGDLTVNNLTGGTLIGLIANGCVWVYHPIDSRGRNVLSTPVSTIQAGILALQHSFLTENHVSGTNLGNLNVTGAIAQKFRGWVGSTGNGTSHGYFKNYAYDPRLLVMQPPFFLQPASAPWHVASITDGSSSTTP